MRAAASFVVGLAALAASSAQAGTWSAGPAMTNARSNAAAVTLADGRVLVVGGRDATSSAFAFYTGDLYNPVTNTWTQTSYSNGAHSAEGLVRLNDGNVLVVAGLSASGVQPMTELYKPATNSWQALASLNKARYSMSVVKLQTGSVLAIGGAEVGGRMLATAELYNPATNAWTYVAPMNVPRRDQTATVLPDGRVLVAGGTTTNDVVLASAEIYDPVANTWTLVGSLAAGRYTHRASLLASGKVLVSGGEGTSNLLATAELFKPGDQCVDIGRIARDHAPAASAVRVAQRQGAGGHGLSRDHDGGELLRPPPPMPGARPATCCRAATRPWARSTATAGRSSWAATPTRTRS